MKYRIVKKPNIWTRSEVYYPEFRWNWWPFWFRFDNNVGYQLHFKRETDAENFINGATNKAGKENQKTDNQSCPECDALASYGSNDGPCETHKL
jgi:hypothetical protein